MTAGASEGRFQASGVPVAVSLGSNLGDRLAALELAVRRLEEHLDDLRCSPVYETEPMYEASQPTFLNMCCVGRTRLEPGSLLTRFLDVEEAAGRGHEGERDAPRYRPRRLDLDLLLYDDLTLDHPGLHVPHPRMVERAFVLIPLREVAAEWRHPGTGRTIGELADGVEVEGVRLFRDRPLPATIRRRLGGGGSSG